MEIGFVMLSTDLIRHFISIMLVTQYWISFLFIISLTKHMLSMFTYTHTYICISCACEKLNGTLIYLKDNTYHGIKEIGNITFGSISNSMFSTSLRSVAFNLAFVNESSFLSSPLSTSSVLLHFCSFCFF